MEYSNNGNLFEYIQKNKIKRLKTVNISKDTNKIP
jgi:hypothetical protein